MKTGMDIEEGRYAWSLCSYIVKSVPINERMPNPVYLWVSLSPLSTPCAASNDTINTLSLQAVLSPFSLSCLLCCEGLYPHFATSLLILEGFVSDTAFPHHKHRFPVFPSCVVIILPSSYCWLCGRYPIILSPALGNLLIHCCIAFFSISGHDRHHSRFF